MKTIVISEAGGPEILTLEERPTPCPGPGQVLVDVRVAGVNFVDTAIRRDWVVEVPGAEGTGVVAETGADVHGVAPGDRVAWVDNHTYSSYAEKVVVPVGSLVPVPDDIDGEAAGALLLQGLTAHHFTTNSHPVQPGDVARLYTPPPAASA